MISMDLLKTNNQVWEDILTVVIDTIFREDLKVRSQSLVPSFVMLFDTSFGFQLKLAQRNYLICFLAGPSVDLMFM
jgi:hypothetical protein